MTLAVPSAEAGTRVTPPAVGAVRRGQAAGVVATGAQLPERRSAGNGNRHSLRPPSEPPAELAQGVVSPAIRPIERGKGTGMIPPGADLGELKAPRDADGGGPIGKCAVTQP